MMPKYVSVLRNACYEREPSHVALKVFRNSICSMFVHFCKAFFLHFENIFDADEALQ